MTCKRLAALFFLLTCLMGGALCAASAEDESACLDMVACFRAAEALRLGMPVADFEAILAEKEIVCTSRTEESGVAYDFLPCLTLAVIGDPIEAAELRTFCAVHETEIRLPIVLLHDGGMEQFSAAMSATDHTAVSASMAECTAWLEEHGLSACWGKEHPQDGEIQRTLTDYMICCALMKLGLPRQDVLNLLDAWTAVNGGRCMRVGYDSVHPDEKSQYRLNSLPMYNCADLAMGLIFEDGRLVCCQLMAHHYGAERTTGGMVTVQSDVNWDVLK